MSRPVRLRRDIGETVAHNRDANDMGGGPVRLRRDIGETVAHNRDANEVGWDESGRDTVAS